MLLIKGVFWKERLPASPESAKKHVCSVEEELLAWKYRAMAFPLGRKKQSKEGGLIYPSVGNFNQELPSTDPQCGRLPDRL